MFCATPLWMIHVYSRYYQNHEYKLDAVLPQALYSRVFVIPAGIDTNHMRKLIHVALQMCSKGARHRSRTEGFAHKQLVHVIVLETLHRLNVYSSSTVQWIEVWKYMFIIIIKTENSKTQNKMNNEPNSIATEHTRYWLCSMWNSQSQWLGRIPKIGQRICKSWIFKIKCQPKLPKKFSRSSPL